MKTFEDYKKQQMQDPELVREYEAIQPEMDVIRAIVNARTSQNLTQNELAKRTGINQADISKLENGTRNLNVTLIEKLCSLFGCTEDYLLGREDAYLPLNFAFRSNKIQAEDLESIAAVNKIVMNIRYMNEKMGD